MDKIKKNFFMKKKKKKIFNKPYDPNLRRRAANKTEPAVGASTCALGSQKCKVKKGNLTKNIKKKKKELKFEKKKKKKFVILQKKKFIFNIKIIEGIEKNNV